MELLISNMSTAKSEKIKISSKVKRKLRKTVLRKLKTDDTIKNKMEGLLTPVVPKSPAYFEDCSIDAYKKKVIDYIYQDDK